ncbi:TraB/GumN family protein [Alteromonadaceae bacterium BrNp21-10]|nr:TraB/GumN family protein [Alteromonadaceae bacterium BrNp21-10]
MKFFSLITLLLSINCFAGSPVWKVSNDTHSLYIGGTMHLLTAEDFPLPEVFDKAYAEADVLMFETDMDKMSSPAFQQQFMTALTYQDSTTLRDVLQPETMAAIEAHLRQRNLPLTNFIKFKPSLLGIMLSVIEMQSMGLNMAGVDEYYNKLAAVEHKPRLHLESVEQQIAFLANLADGQEDRYMMYSLEEIKAIHEELGELLLAWRTGDYQKMDQDIIVPMKKDFPSIYQSLILKRNLAWLPQIEKALSTDETEFMLVGALHLVGQQGVLQQLKDLGYRLEAIK